MQQTKTKSANVGSNCEPKTKISTAKAPEQSSNHHGGDVLVSKLDSDEREGHASKPSVPATEVLFSNPSAKVGLATGTHKPNEVKQRVIEPSELKHKRVEPKEVKQKTFEINDTKQSAYKSNEAKQKIQATQSMPKISPEQAAMIAGITSWMDVHEPRFQERHGELTSNGSGTFRFSSSKFRTRQAVLEAAARFRMMELPAFLRAAAAGDVPKFNALLSRTRAAHLDTTVRAAHVNVLLLSLVSASWHLPANIFVFGTQFTCSSERDRCLSILSHPS